MLRIRWLSAMPSIRSVDLAPGAIPAHIRISSPQTVVPPHTKWQLTPLPAGGNQSWAGQGANTEPRAWQMSQRLQLLSHCHMWLMRSCHHQGSLNTNAKAEGTAQISVLCKYTNSYMQAHTYSLNDTGKTCAVSLA